MASFVTESETTDAVKEALSVIKKWNRDWAPKHFMVDYAEEEISAVEDLFPGAFDMSDSFKYCGVCWLACLFRCCCLLKYTLETWLRKRAYTRKQFSACPQLE